jgi:hypothetical protein
MSHLTIETLARLVDEVPNTEEAAHLELCDDCRIELEGLKADAAALANLPEIEPPAAQWLGIEHRLAAEGMLSSASRRAARRWTIPVLQAAAAVAIFIVGNISAPLLRRQTVQQNAPVASSTATGGDLQSATSSLQETQAAYQAALMRYAELAGQSETMDPLARLAALESIVLTTRAALGQAPTDPVINGYHMTALAQRDATIKRLASNRNEQTWF